MALSYSPYAPMIRYLLAFILCVTTTASLAESAEDYYDNHSLRASDLPANAPRFSQFAVGSIYRGRPAAPDVTSDPESRMFRTMIRMGAKRGPNFAGHYTIVEWGCGAGCRMIAIVDAASGKVFHPANLGTVDNSNIAYDELEPPEGDLIKFRKDSRLLVVIGGINEDDKLRGISYFVWENDKLRRIRFVPKPYE